MAVPDHALIGGANPVLRLEGSVKTVLLLGGALCGSLRSAKALLFIPLGAGTGVRNSSVSVGVKAPGDPITLSQTMGPANVEPLLKLTGSILFLAALKNSTSNNSTSGQHI
jgi:hypothetical protein